MSARRIEFQHFIKLQRGFDLPKSQMKEGEVPVIGSNCIIGYHNEAKVEPPGVVTGRSGTLGLVQYTEIPYWPHNTALWVKDFKGNFPKFVYYKLQTMHLENFNAGVSVPTLNRNALDTLPVSIPDYDTQHRIADTLSVYDDLIENNRRRAALLEESARLLYKEWFVHLRFPGYEHVKMTGGVPEGWDTPHLADLCHVGRGASPRPINAYLGGETPWFKIGDATASEGPFILETKECVTDDGVRKSIRLSPVSLILSNSATCGVPYFTGVEGCVHDGWLYFDQYERISKLLLYCFLFFKQRELTQSVGDGSTQKNLNTIVVGRLRVPLPRQNSLLDLFSDIAEPLFSMILSLVKENMNLRKARDLLLSRLMNGEIAI